MANIKYFKGIIAFLLLALLFACKHWFDIKDPFILGTISSIAAILIGYIFVYIFLERRGVSSWDLFAEKVTIDISSRMNAASRHGLQEVFFDRDQSFSINDYGKWDTYLNHLSSQIDAIGINLDGLLGFEKVQDNAVPEQINFDDYPRIKTLIRRINEGTTVRIVIPKINSEYLKLRANTETIDAPMDRWRKRLELNKKILNFIKENKLDDKGKLMIREYENIMYYFMLRSGDLMIVAPYLNYVKGGNSPAFVLRDRAGDTSLFLKFKVDFGNIFNESSAA